MAQVHGAVNNSNAIILPYVFAVIADMKLNRLTTLLARTLLGIAFSVSFPFGSPVFAQDSDSIHIIRDAEIEYYIRELATPVFRAAEIDPKSVSLVIIKSNVINAFVAGGMNEFFYTGLLQATESPEQLLGIIAHETGHMAGGHLIRGNEAMRNASTQAIIGMILGVAAGVASGKGDVAMGAISGAQQIAQRNILSFSRTQENSADAAGLTYMDRAGVTSRGMLEFMEKLKGQEMLPTDRQVEYVRTHPLTQDRIDSVAYHLKNSPYANKKLDPKFAVMHERMKAKLMGFLQPETALLRYTGKDQRLTARYARAIALYQSGQLQRALDLMDGLIKEEPNNPFFYELKAQALFENGRVEEAVPLYKKGVDLLPNSALLRIAYAHALLESKDTSRIDLAIQQLTEANRYEERAPETWRYLASAWGRKAELTKDPQYEGLASYALAEEAMARGADKEAKQFVDRAVKILPKGSPYWLRTQDIKMSTDKEQEEDRQR